MVSRELRYDPDSNELVNVVSGARTAPANTIEAVALHALNLREVLVPRRPRFRDTVTGVEYDPFVGRSVRHYDAPQPPSAPLAPTVTRAGGQIHITTPYLYPTGATDHFTLRLVTGEETVILGRDLPSSTELVLDGDRYPDAGTVAAGAVNPAGTTWGPTAALAAAV